MHAPFLYISILNKVETTKQGGNLPSISEEAKHKLFLWMQLRGS